MPTSTTADGNRQSSQPSKSEILLESGTNELEVLVFMLGENLFGVNVAKVREVITPVDIVASPDQPECVIGLFNLRGRVLPLVDLHRYLNFEPANADVSQWRHIVTEFNGNNAAFRVEAVEHIYRINWEDIKTLPDTGDLHESVTGVAQIGDRLVMMLDFETIFDSIAATDSNAVGSVENKFGVDRSKHIVYFAEDSKFVRGAMEDLLAQCGFREVRTFVNGSDCWEAISSQAASNADASPTVLASDIEMPQMDGLTLTRKIKTDSRLSHIRVILFSSLISSDTRHKGEQVGANVQIAKPQFHEVVAAIDEQILEWERLQQAA